MSSIRSLLVENEQQVVLANMKPAYLAFSGPVFGGEILEDIGYEIYRLGTLVQALNPMRPDIDSKW